MSATTEHQEAPTPHRDADWWTGYDDGQLGQTWLEHRRILRTEAEHDKAIQVAQLEQRLAGERAEQNVAKLDLEREEARYQDADTRLGAAQTDRHRYPGQYSAKLGLGFIVSAVLMMAADFPLSRAIAVEILEDDPAAFFTHTTAVAFGIVAMGLFFKLLADPFTRPRYLLPRYLRGVSLLTTGALAVLIAGGLAFALIMLGVFRGEVSTAEAETGTNNVIYGATPTTTTQPSGVLHQMNAALTLDIGDVAKFAFLTLALALPMLGGIFISTGFTRLHNREQLARLERTYPERESSYAAAFRRYHERTAAVTTLEHEVELARARPTLANSRYHMYLHGYERGACTDSSTDRGVAQEVLGLVRRWLRAARQRDSFLRSHAIAKTHTDEDAV